MANILSRFGSIMSANINALLDKAEDPEKMIDQNLRELREDLAEVKEQTAGVMADEKAAARKLEECKKHIADCEIAQVNAVKAGDDDGARAIISEKLRYQGNLPSLQQTYDVAHANSEKMKAMYNKLVGDINQLESRKDAIKGKIAVAKATEKVNKMTSNASKANSSIEDFDRWEDRANKMLDKANAETELNQQDIAAEDYVTKYKDSTDFDVEAELAKTKASLGM